MKLLLLGVILATANLPAQDSACPAPPGNNVAIEGYVVNPGVYPLAATMSAAIARLADLPLALDAWPMLCGVTRTG